MRLIIVDGLDGVGKDTHAELIKKRYLEKNEKVILRSHPEDDNFFGIKAKKALLGRGKINKFKASLFYMMDVLRSVRKYYNKGDVDTLIMVRYLIGTAYLPEKLVKFGYKFFYNFVPTSDYLLFIDAPPDIILKRIQSRDKHEIFETYDNLVKVRKKAMLLVNNWFIIDSSSSVDNTFLKIERILDNLD